jgi:metacaspase-1
MTKRALCIGINQYLDPSNELRGCRNDAFDMAAFFQIELQIAQDNITVILDKLATKAGIMAELERLKEISMPGDYLAFSQSSHGTQQFDISGDELDLYDEALCCHDTAGLGNGWDPKTIILDDEFRDYCNQLRPGVLFEAWFDSCHSASGLKYMGMTYDKARIMVLPENEIKCVKTKKPKRMGLSLSPYTVLWAACEADKLSADTFLNGKWCGAFTNAFLSTYGPVKRSALLSRIRDKLKQGDYDQIPQLDTVDSNLRSMLVGT